jgi:hypothetical protein
VREELGDELGDEPLPFGELNSKLWAWIGAEYHLREHDTTKRSPQRHFLDHAESLRPVPPNKNIDEVFLHRVRRTVRADGTVRFKGGFLEVRPELVALRTPVELRFDPSAPDVLPRVFVNDRFVCDTVRLDRLANHGRKRRTIKLPVPSLPPSGIDPLAQLEDEHYRRGRPVTPSISAGRNAYSTNPKPTSKPENNT